MHAPAMLAPTDVETVWAALAEIPDPEIPTISIVDLGVVRSVDLCDDGVTVELLPTFVGCPALEVIRMAVEERLAGVRERVDVVFSFAEPWTTERINDRGRLGLIAGGFAPPARDGATRWFGADRSARRPGRVPDVRFAPDPPR